MLVLGAQGTCSLPKKVDFKNAAFAFVRSGLGADNQ